MVVSWTPDSRRRPRVDKTMTGTSASGSSGSGSPSRGLWSRSPQHHPNHYVRGGQLHEGRWLVYAANLDAESGEEIEADRLYRHDLRNGERRSTGPSREGQHSTARAEPPGTHVLYPRNDLRPGRTAGLARGRRRPGRPRDPELRSPGQGLGLLVSATGAGSSSSPRRNPTAGWACGDGRRVRALARGRSRAATSSTLSCRRTADPSSWWRSSKPGSRASLLDRLNGDRRTPAPCTHEATSIPLAPTGG